MTEAELESDLVVLGSDDDDDKVATPSDFTSGMIVIY